MKAAASDNGRLCCFCADAQESWKEVPGYPGCWVSDLGRVASAWFRSRRPFVGSLSADGYLGVRLHTLSPPDVAPPPVLSRKVHTLVLTAFRGPRPPGMDARHLDGDPLNNRLSNLVWGSRQENVRDCVRHGRATSHRVTSGLAQAVRADRAAGLTFRQLATKHRFSVMTIWRILRQGQSPPPITEQDRLVAPSATRLQSEEDANEGASQVEALSPLRAGEGCEARRTGPAGPTPISDNLRTKESAGTRTGDGGRGGNVRDRTESLSTTPESVLGASPRGPDRLAAAGPSPIPQATRGPGASPPRRVGSPVEGGKA